MINFIKSWKFGNFFTLIMLFISIFSFFKYDLNLGIDFTGGILMEIQSESVEFKKDEIIKLSDEFSKKDIKNIIQFNGDNRLILKLQENSKEKNLIADQSKKILHEILGESRSIKYEKIDYIGASVGHEFFQKSFFALTMSIFGILVYLLIRFDWRFALSGIVGLIHDIIITFGFISLFKIELSMMTITAILTIIGYSINDSVIIFDRIRELLKLNIANSEKDIKGVINISLNNTMTRTIFTSVTTLLSALALILFGGKALYSFSVVIFFGIIIGTYSSIFIASQLLVLLDRVFNFNNNKSLENIRES